MTSIKKNYIYSALYQILTILIPLITVPYLSRIMGAQNLGIYSYTNSIAHYFSIFAILGMSNYGNRTIAMIRDDRKKLNKTFSELFLLQFVIGFIVFLLYVFYCLYLYISKNIYFIYSLIWSFYVISCAIDISWFFWGIEEFRITVLRNSIIKIISTICIFAFVNEKTDLFLYVFIISFSSFLSQIILWTQLNKYVNLQKVKISEIKKHFKGNLILFIPVIAVSIYTIMDKLMLGKLGSMKQLGFYDNTQKIITIATGIITALGTVMLPRLSNLIAKKDMKNVLNYIDMSMQFTAFFSVAFTFGLSSISNVFSIVYFGKGFEECALMLMLFSITIIFIGWANIIRTHYLIPMEYDYIYIISVFLGAFVNLLFNLILIPKYNANGAVIGTIFAEFTVAFVQTFKVRKELPIKKYLYRFLPFLINGSIMFLIVFYLGNKLEVSILTLIIQIICGMVVYSFLGFFTIMKSNTELSNQIMKYITKFKENIHCKDK